jgi:hypothetical protein
MKVGKVSTYQNNRCDITDSNNRHRYRCGNLKYHNKALYFVSVILPYRFSSIRPGEQSYIDHMTNPYIGIKMPLKQQFAVTHTTRQTEIPTLLASWVKTHLLSKCCVHKKQMLFFLYIFVKT